MADKKISALTVATTPLAGTEVLPIVQSGATVKVAVSDLTAGRAISATQITLTTGSVIVASGQGIDFSATPGTGTSELFDDYEEGTWTPSVTSSIGTITTLGTVTGTYTKIGEIVTLFTRIDVTLNGTGAGVIKVAGLPYSASTSILAYSGYGKDRAITGKMLAVDFVPTTSFFEVTNYDNTYPAATGATLMVTVIYTAA